MKKFKLIISDFHLGSGSNDDDGNANPFEDFIFDDEFVEFIEYFITGEYEDAEVELVINGDFIDFLNIRHRDRFTDRITERLAVWKFNQVVRGHPLVFEALRIFCLSPNKRLTVMIGNHDPEFFFPKVRERFIQVLEHSDVNIVYYSDRYELEGGVLVMHGHQFEAANMFNYTNPFEERGKKAKYLSLPWGSIFLLKVINPLRKKREYINRIYPIRLFIFFGLVIDFRFTFQLILRSTFEFLRTRIFIPWWKKKASLWNTLKILRDELKVFIHLDRYARRILSKNPHLNSVVMGHTHYPMKRFVLGDRTYVNTGTWTRVVSLHLGDLGHQIRRPYALVSYDERGYARVDLMEWLGQVKPTRRFV